MLLIKVKIFISFFKNEYDKYFEETIKLTKINKFSKKSLRHFFSESVYYSVTVGHFVITQTLKLFLLVLQVMKSIALIETYVYPFLNKKKAAILF